MTRTLRCPSCALGFCRYMTQATAALMADEMKHHAGGYVLLRHSCRGPKLQGKGNSQD